MWIGALAKVNQGLIIGSQAMLTTGSVATKDLQPYSIYQEIPPRKYAIALS